MAPSKPSAKPAPDAGTLLSDAGTQAAVGNVDAAISLATTALETTGPGGDFELPALNLLGFLHVESGDEDEARAYYLRAIKLDEDGTLDDKVGGGADKFLFMAQLSEEGGQDSVRYFERGAAVLRRQAQALAALPSRTPALQASHDEKQEKLGEVLCAVAEVYMTDLSWEDDAEQRCEALVTEAMMIAPENPETWQTVANVRISQARVDEAREALRRSMAIWKDLPPEHVKVPDYPVRIALARMLIEVDMEEEANEVIERLVADDDQSVEAWYLGAMAQYDLGDKMRAAGGDEELWHAVWASSRRWLARCMKLYEQHEYEDERLGQHAIELAETINKELGPPPPGFEDDWPEDSGDEDDAEMKG